MGSIERLLAERGLQLPEAVAPVGNYEPVKIHGELAFVAGHAPMDGTRVLVTGLVGESLSLEEGYEAARLTALAILASLRQALGDLDRVQAWIRAVGYVHCAPGFDRHADVLNGFSDLIIDLWGEAGRHARSAPGQGPSPLGVPIIIDAVVAMSPPLPL
jgi:enamine deaminase RidA (YjgF/YER057c/UK114 family)